MWQNGVRFGTTMPWRMLAKNSKRNVDGTLAAVMVIRSESMEGDVTAQTRVPGVYLVGIIQAARIHGTPR